MEVAPRYKLLTLFTLIRLLSLFILFTLFTLLPPLTLLTLFKQIWSKSAICLYMIWLYCLKDF